MKQWEKVSSQNCINSVEKQALEDYQKQMRIKEARMKDNIDFSLMRPLSRDTRFMESLRNYDEHCEKTKAEKTVTYFKKAEVRTDTRPHKNWLVAQNVIKGTRYDNPLTQSRQGCLTSRIHIPRFARFWTITRSGQ